MALRIGDEAPNSRRRPPKAPSTSTNGSATSGRSCFSHPKDFTPVCTTEPRRHGQAEIEFDKRNTRSSACRPTRWRTTKVGQGHRGNPGRGDQLPHDR